MNAVVDIVVNNGLRVVAPIEAVHMTVRKDGTAGLWVNGNGMGEVDAKTAEDIRKTMVDAIQRRE